MNPQEPKEQHEVDLEDSRRATKEKENDDEEDPLKDEATPSVFSMERSLSGDTSCSSSFEEVTLEEVDDDTSSYEEITLEDNNNDDDDDHDDDNFLLLQREEGQEPIPSIRRSTKLSAVYEVNEEVTTTSKEMEEQSVPIPRQGILQKDAKESSKTKREKQKTKKSTTTKDKSSSNSSSRSSKGIKSRQKELSNTSKVHGHENNTATPKPKSTRKPKSSRTKLVDKDETTALSTSTSTSKSVSSSKNKKSSGSLEKPKSSKKIKSIKSTSQFMAETQDGITLPSPKSATTSTLALKSSSKTIKSSTRSSTKKPKSTKISTSSKKSTSSKIKPKQHKSTKKLTASATAKATDQEEHHKKKKRKAKGTPKAPDTIHKDADSTLANQNHFDLQTADKTTTKDKSDTIPAEKGSRLPLYSIANSTSFVWNKQSIADWDSDDDTNSDDDGGNGSRPISFLKRQDKHAEITPRRSPAARGRLVKYVPSKRKLLDNNDNGSYKNGDDDSVVSESDEQMASIRSQLAKFDADATDDVLDDDKDNVAEDRDKEKARSVTQTSSYPQGLASKSKKKLGSSDRSMRPKKSNKLAKSSVDLDVPMKVTMPAKKKKHPKQAKSNPNFSNTTKSKQSKSGKGKAKSKSARLMNVETDDDDSNDNNIPTELMRGKKSTSSKVAGAKPKSSVTRKKKKKIETCD